MAELEPKFDLQKTSFQELERRRLAIILFTIFVALACISAGLYWKHNRDLMEQKVQLQQNHDRDLAQLDADVEKYNHIMQTAQATARNKDAIADDITRIKNHKVKVENDTQAEADMPDVYPSALDADKIIQKDDDDDIERDNHKDEYLTQQLDTQITDGLLLYKKFQANPLYLQQYKETTVCLDGDTVVAVTNHSRIPLEIGDLRFIEHR